MSDTGEIRILLESASIFERGEVGLGACTHTGRRDPGYSARCLFFIVPQVWNFVPEWEKIGTHVPKGPKNNPRRLVSRSWRSLIQNMKKI